MIDEQNERMKALIGEKVLAYWPMRTNGEWDKNRMWSVLPLTGDDQRLLKDVPCLTIVDAEVLHSENFPRKTVLRGRLVRDFDYAKDTCADYLLGTQKNDSAHPALFLGSRLGGRMEGRPGCIPDPEYRPEVYIQTETRNEEG